MAGLSACLIDVYETVLTCDFTAHETELPALAGVPAERWNREFSRLVPELTDGRLSMAEAYAEVVRRSGGDPRPRLVLELVRRDHELLIERSQLHADTVPFLQMLRRRGITTAFVSNCAENTRPLLATLGLSALVDGVVLSCEVGSAKPSAGIYEVALRLLGVPADAALFVDDQPAYCDGAAALGIRAVRIERGGSEQIPPDAAMVVRSLLELEPVF